MVSDNSGNLYIVAAPSGGGKTSLVKKLIEWWVRLKYRFLIRQDL